MYLSFTAFLQGGKNNTSLIHFSTDIKLSCRKLREALNSNREKASVPTDWKTIKKLPQNITIYIDTTYCIYVFILIKIIIT